MLNIVKEHPTASYRISGRTQSGQSKGGRSAYWSQQLKSGRAILRGAVNDYWGNTAVMVFEAASCEEAETICRRDAHRALGRPSGTLLLPENLV